MNLIRFALKTHHLSQKQLSQLTGMNKDRINRLCHSPKHWKDCLTVREYETLNPYLNLYDNENI